MGKGSNLDSRLRLSISSIKGFKVTVEGELSVANFIDNSFKQAPLPGAGCAPRGSASTDHQVRQNWLT